MRARGSKRCRRRGFKKYSQRPCPGPDDRRPARWRRRCWRRCRQVCFRLGPPRRPRRTPEARAYCSCSSRRGTWSPASRPRSCPRGRSSSRASTGGLRCRSGLVGATQGRYSQVQALLDISPGDADVRGRLRAEGPAGARVRPDAGRGVLRGLRRCRGPRRAGRPPTSIPGCWAARCPGARDTRAWRGARSWRPLPAADRAGIVRDLSIGPARDVAKRARRCSRTQAVRRRRACPQASSAAALSTQLLAAPRGRTS